MANNSDMARQHLLQDVTGFKRSCVIVAAAELDLASIMLHNGGSLNVAQIAELAECDPRGCEVLLDCMVALGYFEKIGTGAAALYSVNNDYAEALDSKNPHSEIPVIRHKGNIMRNWAQLAWCVKNGEQGSSPASILGAEQDRISFIMAMNAIARGIIGDVMTSLLQSGILPDRNTAFTLLDVGGASGTYTEAFLDLFPLARAVIFDLPDAIVLAKKRFEGHPYASRIEYVQGDFTRDELPANNDFAWVSAIIHQFGREESRNLYGKIYRALNNGGTIAVRDFIMNEQHTSPVNGALFGINMLVNTRHGRVYSFTEIEEDLQASGFSAVKLAVDAPTMGAVAAAKKVV